MKYKNSPIPVSHHLPKPTYPYNKLDTKCSYPSEIISKPPSQKPRNATKGNHVFKLLVVSVCMLCNTFMSNIILPFMTFMVSRYDVPLELVGRYSGYLMSSYMFGQLMSSYYWGHLADTFGRRPTLIIGLLLSGVSFLMFGIFNQSFYLAAVIRFMNGAFNGIAGITKTYVSEITTEKTQAQGFAYLGVARSLGMILGPLVGGFLCLPAEKYPSLFPEGSVFDVYPFALPCLVGFSVAITGAILAYLVLEETLVQTKPLPCDFQPVTSLSHVRKHGVLTYHAVETLSSGSEEDDDENHSEDLSSMEPSHYGSTLATGLPASLQYSPPTPSENEHSKNSHDHCNTDASDLLRPDTSSRRRYSHRRQDSHTQPCALRELFALEALNSEALDEGIDLSSRESTPTIPFITTYDADRKSSAIIYPSSPIDEEEEECDHDSIPSINYGINNVSKFDSKPSDPASTRIRVEDDDSTIAQQQTPSILQLLSTRRVGMTMLVWTCVSALYIQFDEVFALWSRLPRSSQGLDFGSSQQGTVFTIGGIALGVYQMFLFAKVEKAMGTVNAFRMGLLISIPAFILLPISYIFHADPRINSSRGFEWGVWFMVGLAEMLRTVGGFQAFTTVFIMVSNSTTSNMRGSINGLGQTLGALGRMIGPVFAGTLFSFSLTNLNFVVHGIQMAPFIIFTILILFCMVIWLLSFQLSRTIGSRLPEPSRK